MNQKLEDFFPFSNIRQGQREFAEDVYQVLDEKKSLLAHAPTGIGKTAGVLSPALKYSIENDKKVIFLTPRHSQHIIALETLKKIREKTKIAFSGCDLIGKKWLCNVDSIENMGSGDFIEYCASVRKDDRCPFYNRTFSKEDKRLKGDARKLIGSLSSKINSAYDVKNKVKEFCPYEILMQMLKYSRVIIADYFHIFHPKVRESMFGRIGIDLENCIIIVDEAHNLPERIRSLLSSQTSNYNLDRVRKECNLYGFHETEEKIHEIEVRIKELFKRRLENERERFIEKNEIIELIEQVEKSEEFILELEGIASTVREKKRRSFCGGLSEFLRNWKEGEEGFARILRNEKVRNKNLNRIMLKGLNPAFYSNEVLNNSHSSILMSGTLIPLEMYKDVLGIKNARLKSYKSDFKDGNKLNIVVDKVTTKYSQRDENQFKKIGWYISQCCQAVKGNVGVFFPSYFLRDKVLEYVSIRKKILMENSVDKKNRLNLLKDLESFKADGAVLFGVFRGSFDQGVDYPGDLMNGVILVGLPLERPDLETQALINYYDLLFQKGWDYGYIYPAMNLAIQASGRCIRSEEDRGVVVFLDERYLWGNYRKVFPPEMNLKVSKAPWIEIEEFWKC